MTIAHVSPRRTRRPHSMDAAPGIAFLSMPGKANGRLREWSALRFVLLGMLVVVGTAVDADEPRASKTKTVKIRDIELKVPETWVSRPPANRLRLAQFDIPLAEGDKGKVELVVSSFGGSGGGIDPNIRRWINQFQPQGRKVTLTTGESPQGKYVVADIRGTYNQPVGPPILRQTRPLPNARMIAVILMPPNKPYYFLKMAGPAKTVSAAAEDLRRAFGADPSKEKPYEPGN